MTSRALNRLAVSATAAVLVVGCAADGSGLTETGAGAAIGTATGAAAGAIIGSFGANAGRGALIGAVGGAIAGGMVGAYMQEQRRDFEKALASEIASGMVSIEQLPNNELVVRMTGATSFEIDSDRIQPGFYSTMDKISAIVRKYGKTELLVAGHTDNTGSAEHNQLLSERRANAVASYMLSDGVLPERISARGYGKNQPIASNESESGRSLNRRVDITIIPITA
jgi:outer membrane protein OmpA-like peptidoglycan-associated protein